MTRGASNIPPQSDPFIEAVRLHQAGRLSEATDAYDRAAAMQPQNFAIHANRGVALLALGRLNDALASLDRAIALKADDAISHNNRGNVLRTLGRSAEALESYEQALRLMPRSALLLVNCGNVLMDLQRYKEALERYDAAISIESNNAMAHNGRGSVLLELDQNAEAALASFDRALAIDPNLGVAYYNRGNAKRKLDRHEDALKDYDRSLQLIPGSYQAHSNRGSALAKMRRLREALASYERALSINPQAFEPVINRADLLMEAGQADEALQGFADALARNPASARAHMGRANALVWLGRNEEAIGCADEAISLGEAGGLGLRLLASMKLCDWSRFEDDCTAIRVQIDRHAGHVFPFYLLAAIDDPKLQRANAEQFIRHEFGSIARSPLPPYRHERIRIGYVSADFRNHAVMQLFIETLEHHDKSRFEVFGFSCGPRIDDAFRRRAERSCSQFFDIDAMSETEAVELLRSKEVDIAVDLTGFTRFARTGLFARGTAPIQVNYLGYAATLGATFMDYIIADPIVADATNLDGFSEHVVELNGSFLPNAALGSCLPKPTSRREHGLPQDTFVFASLNNHHKITPPIFDTWMRILHRVPESVLWIRCDSDTARTNLQREAEKRGIAQSRLVFTGQVSEDDHLGRFTLADLFLDTTPYNAHTTASEALRCGLPVLTCGGATFASRVAKSLLTAAGAPELAVGSLREYEDAAVRLTQHPDELKDLRDKICTSLPTSSLFDVPRYTRQLEAAYAMMVERAAQGLPPARLIVSA